MKVNPWTEEETAAIHTGLEKLNSAIPAAVALCLLSAMITREDPPSDSDDNEALFAATKDAVSQVKDHPQGGLEVAKGFVPNDSGVEGATKLADIARNPKACAQVWFSVFQWFEELKEDKQPADAEDDV